MIIPSLVISLLLLPCLLVVAEKMTKEQIAEAQKLSREMIEANPKLMGD